MNWNSLTLLLSGHILFSSSGSNRPVRSSGDYLPKVFDDYIPRRIHTRNVSSTISSRFDIALVIQVNQSLQLLRRWLSPYVNKDAESIVTVINVVNRFFPGLIIHQGGGSYIIITSNLLDFRIVLY